MRLRLSWLVFSLLVPTLTYADDHNADHYTGFSGGGGGSTVYGIHQAFAIELKPWRGDFAFVPADFSVQFGEQVTQVIYMLGARYTLANNTNPIMHPHKALFQALIGTVYTNDAATMFTDKDFAFALGAGYEYVKDNKWSVRAQFDRIMRNGDRDEWFNRFSAGFSYRWSRTPPVKPVK